jgi:spore coat polysaccharide biosynthesis protein SpsF
MEKVFKTKQEKFWAGEFGDNYIDRNVGQKIIASNTAMFANIIRKTSNINSILEFGSNIGLNLLALKNLLPEVELSAIEINDKAVSILKANMGIKNVYHQSILDFRPDYQRDFVLIKGVLIHINPDMLHEVYKLLCDSSKKYICIMEYYNPTPVSIPYRGHEGYLFKRDFAGEIMDIYPSLQLIDYGFVYHRDNNFSQDDGTWFLLSK